METYTRNLELYEFTRSCLGREKLVIPVQKRSRMLLEAGYTQEEIILRALEVAESRTKERILSNPPRLRASKISQRC
jgi:hypothetical protein